MAACVPIPPLEQAPAGRVAESAGVSPTEVSVVAMVETPTDTAAPTFEATATLALTATSAPTATQTPTLVPTAIPTLAPTATRAPTRTSTLAPTRTASPRPTATRQVSAARLSATRTPIPTPTVDRHLVIITEADIAESIAGGKAREQGVTAQNLKVDFANGKMRVTADRLGYGLLNLQNLDMTGRLTAIIGVLNLVVESISPRGLAANLVPKVANQALAQLGAQWYVEEVKTLDGRVELRVR
jgi:hypothetical protein